MSDKEWRPKVGERVLIVGNTGPECIGREAIVVLDDGADTLPFRVAYSPGDTELFNLEDLSPLPAPAAPRPAWEVLRLAADLLVGDEFYHSRCSLMREAARLEAAAAPKPPLTLAEAAEEVLVAFAEGVLWTAEQKAAYEGLHAALARAEAEAEAGQ